MKISTENLGSLDLKRDLMGAANVSRGHFLYESGHHGDLWLDLDKIFVDAQRTGRWARALAEQVASCWPEVVCGPLTGGAFIAQFLAAELGASFCFAERLVSARGSVEYCIPAVTRGELSGRRILLVDDAINAGSALNATLADLQECGGQLVGIATLLSLGQAAAQIALQQEVPFFALASLQRAIWPAKDCPLCQTRIPLTDFFGTQGQCSDQLIL